MTIQQIFKKFGIVTIAEASQVTGILPDTLNNRVVTGKLKGYKIGKTWLIFLKDVDPMRVN